MKNLANKTLGIEAKSSTEPSDLKNFFILKDFLIKSDILAVETVIEAGSISPEYRAPTEKKTSTSPYDIDVVFNYLTTLDFNALTPVSEQDATVQGGGGKVLTVHTRFGTFEINQIARKFLKVYDKYFILEQEVPYIAGETTTYTFTLDYTDATLYIDGIKFKEYNLNFKDIVCEVSEKTFVMEHHYVLQTYIGDLLILDSKHFKRHGVTYKIINNESFSSIFIDYPITEDMLILLAYLYQLKEQQVNPNVGNGIVLNYYGKYSSGAIVSIMTCEGINYPAVISSESVGKYGVNFYYPDTNAITVLYEGEFHSLSKAYEDGYLTDGDLFSIYYLHSNNYPALYNQDVLPIANGRKLKIYTTRHEKGVNYDSKTEYPVVKVIRTATEYFTYSAQEKITSVHYGESFFEEYNLVALKVKTTNASVSYAVSGVYSLDSGQYSIWLTDKGSGAGATVMGVQNIFIGIPKAEHITESNLEIIFYDFWWM